MDAIMVNFICIIISVVFYLIIEIDYLKILLLFVTGSLIFYTIATNVASPSYSSIFMTLSGFILILIPIYIIILYIEKLLPDKKEE
jgi:hypothetical protein